MGSQLPGRRFAVFLAVLLYFSSSPLVAQELNGEFARGDCNANGIVDISDVIANLSCLFLGNECTSCLEICDIDEDGVMDISDSISLLFCLFLGQKCPVSPTVDCGVSHVISLLVLYPQPAATHLQRMIDTNRAFDETTMDGFLDRTFEHVDIIYANSGLPVTFDVLHSESIDWSDINEDEWKRTLSLALMNSELGNSTYVPYLQRVEDLRNAHSADVVIYWRARSDGGPSANGAGSIGGAENEAYIHMTYFGMKPRLLAHELGHLLGARHEHGYQGEATYSVNGDNPQLREYRTIMTVATPLGLESYRYLWVFSRDGQSVGEDVTCGFNFIDVCGFSSPAPIGDSEHDSVSIISQMAPVVAAFRELPLPDGEGGPR